MNFYLNGEKPSLFDAFEKDFFAKVNLNLSTSRIQKSLVNRFGCNEYKIQERTENYGKFHERYAVFTDTFLHIYDDKDKLEYVKS